MAILPEKPAPFRPGARVLSASDLNKMVNLSPRQIVGGGDVDVEQVGDRMIVRGRGRQGSLPDVVNYVTKFTVLYEFDDYLTCSPFVQPVNDSNVWAPYVYNASYGPPQPEVIYVAKPFLLQKQSFNGVTVDLGGGESVTYSYPSPGDRVGTHSPGGDAVSESITPPYLPGETIIAVSGVTGMKDQVEGNDIVWTDLNNAGRTWGPSGPDTSPTSPTYCNNHLAALQKTDCLLATGPDNSVYLTYDPGTGRWLSTDTLTYPGAGSGLVEFWFSGGSVHLSVGATATSGTPPQLELLGCGDGCFEGGPLTGHITPTKCVNTPCCPHPVPETLYATVTSADCPFLAGVHALIYHFTDSMLGITRPTWLSANFSCPGTPDLVYRFAMYCNPGTGAGAGLILGVQWTSAPASSVSVWNGFDSPALPANSYACDPFSASFPTFTTSGSSSFDNCCASPGSNSLSAVVSSHNPAADSSAVVCATHCNGPTFKVCVDCAVCPGVSTTCCPGVQVPKTLYLTMSSVGCPCLNLSVPLVYGSVTPGTSWACFLVGQCSASGSPATLEFQLHCAGSVWAATMMCLPTAPGLQPVTYNWSDPPGDSTFSCSPFYLQGSFTLLDSGQDICCPNSGTVDWVITE